MLIKIAELTWSGTRAEWIDVYGDGTLVATVWHADPYRDVIFEKTKRTYLYQVCDAGTSRCSNEVSVTI